ncbi:MAG: glycosyltransferase family 2 protein [Zymomonas mobilis]
MTRDDIRKEIPSLAIVVPCYNESEAFSYCLSQLGQCLSDLIEEKKIQPNSSILFVDDGSRDDTWDQIKAAVHEISFVRGLKLSRNRGHQIALMAGLSHAKTDIIVSIDADLRDDIRCIPVMVEKYMQGNDIVYGVRNDRSSDSFFKRMTANSFYWFMAKMGVQQVANHADFRLLSRRALQGLLAYNEQNLYIRGIVPLVGYPSDKVFYSRSSRIAGESKYPFRKMLALAIEGITSLTVAPLRLISVLGFAACFLSLLGSVYAVFRKFCGEAIEGWASVEISIFFLGGVQLLCLGVIGEYIGKIYMEVKRRPKFLIQEEIGNSDKS